MISANMLQMGRRYTAFNTLYLTRRGELAESGYGENLETKEREKGKKR